MDSLDFAGMMEDAPSHTRMITYFEMSEVDRERRPAAACLTDIFSDGLSMVYSFFDPDIPSRSLGTYMILDHIRMARSGGRPYVYLGYWVPGSPKMDYKSRFSGLEIFYRNRWQRLEMLSEIDTGPPPGPGEPLTRQAASILVPEIVKGKW